MGALNNIDKKASDDIKAQAQGLYFFFYGIAQIFGTFFSTWLISKYTSESVVANAVQASTNWQSIFWVEAAISGALLVFFYLFFKDDTKKA